MTEDLENKIEVIQHKIEKCDDFANDISKINKEIEELKFRHIDLQVRSMRGNLVFTGIDETEPEDTEDVLSSYRKK